MPHVQANGIQIEYETFGEPTSTPVLLIMGLSMQLTAWPLPLCHALADAGYYVVRFDNRDAGLTDKMEGQKAPSMIKSIIRSLLKLPIDAPYTLRDMAQDTIGLMDALSIKQAHVIGVSMGGMVGQILAANEADRVQSLTSIMSSPGNFSHALPKLRVAKHMFLTRPKSDSVDDLLAYSLPLWKLLDSTKHPRTDDEWRDILIQRLNRMYYPPGYIRQTSAILATGDRRKELAHITCPTLVIHGREDGLVPMAAGQETAACIPGSVLRILDGMGHSLSPGELPVITEWLLDHLGQATPQTT